MTGAAGGTRISAGSRLHVPMQRQLGNRLCWAAVAAAIDSYYRGEPVSQRTLIGERGPNEPRSTASALDDLGRLQRAQEGPAAFDVIQREISQRRPIVAGIGLTGSHHVVIIVGWAVIEGRAHVRVSDPRNGSVRLWEYDEFKENLCFRWHRSYFTQ